MGYAFCLACDQFHVSGSLLRPSSERVKHTELWDSFILTTCKGSRKGRLARRLLRENQVCSCLEMKREAKCTMGLHRSQGTKGWPSCLIPGPFSSHKTPPTPASFSAMTLSVLLPHVGHSVTQPLTAGSGPSCWVHTIPAELEEEGLLRDGSKGSRCLFSPLLHLWHPGLFLPSPASPRPPAPHSLTSKGSNKDL